MCLVDDNHITKQLDYLHTSVDVITLNVQLLSQYVIVTST